MNDRARLIKESYERCCKNEQFFETFYRNFFAKSPEVPRLFDQTDFQRQHQALRTALWQMVMYGCGSEDVSVSLRLTAQIHGREFLNIKAELYGLWLDSLCEAIQQHDPEYSADLEQMWREAMQKGIELMTASY